MEKRLTNVKVSLDFLETCIWMSYRYCIGRHTISAAWHAGDIAEYMKYFSDEDQEHFAEDIRSEINTNLGFSRFIQYERIMNTDVLTSLVKYVIDNNIEISKTWCEQHTFFVDADGKISVKTVDTPLADLDTFRYWLTQNMHDIYNWVKLASYCDKKNHRKVIIEDKEETVFVFPEFTIEGKLVLKWTTTKMYEEFPHQNWYIPTENLNFVD